MKLFFAMFVAAAMIPSTVTAQITISEIMYDVEGTDADREWIELYNGGSTETDITGWKVNDGSNHVLNEAGKNGSKGSLIIAAGGYLILAADAAVFTGAYPSIPNVSDTVLSLNNTGDTISLVNAEGATVDSVSYAKETGGAGDGNSLHRSSGASTLTPGAPSPGTGTIPPAVVQETSSGNSGASNAGTSNNSSSASGSSAKSESVVPASKLTVSAGKDRVVVAGSAITFDALAYDSDKKSIDTASFIWSFGDGSKGVDGARVQHEFIYPGRYVVVLSAAYQGNNASHRVVVEAIAAEITLLVYADGGISVENKSRMELDISGWKLRDQGKTFTIPANTIVLPGTSMRLASQTLGFFADSQAELLSPNEALIFHPGGVVPEVVAVQTPPPNAKAIEEKVEKPKTSTRVAAESREEPGAAEIVPEEKSGTKQPIQDAERNVAAAASVWNGDALWWGGAVGIALLGGGAAFVLRRSRKNEWNIEDASEEV